MIGRRHLILILCAIVAWSCGPDQRIIDSAKEKNAEREQVVANANVNATASSFEQDLNAMRTADFKFIVVLRRKDGQALDAPDKELIAKAGAQANRRRLSDEGKAVIIGSNFPFMSGEFESLNKRFNIENHSKPESGPMFSNTTPAPQNGTDRPR